MITIGLIGNIGLPEMLVILVLALLIFGPAKLPGVGKAIGESIRDFRGAVNSREGNEKVDVEEGPKGK